ncbi:LptA/OstA family protein [Caulobacter sp.]|uniref:LptA/OstA family protein n=1 Tax=Caulobacter sp. TaxID=78 RepID=UPI002B477724|nr:LptA/OstA family protein [Caulobacter sp.]HJV40826.1 LptA/OstA family protein [Caulobacter sp.]
MKRWTAAAATALILSGIGAGGVAYAQQGDSSAPIDVSADQQESINSKCISIFRGNVEILQDRSRMRAQQVTVYSAKRAGSENGCGNAQRLEAEGDVYLVSDKQSARGDRAVYTFDNSIAVLTGDVVLVKGKDVARGDRLTVNTKTNDARLESNAKGRGSARRVRAVFYQDDTKKTSSDTPAAAEQPAQR